MKKILFLIALSLCTVLSFAQLEKGSFIGGVNGNFGFSETDEHVEINGSFNPYALYLLRNNLAVGLSLDTRYNAYKFRDIDSTGALLYYSYESGSYGLYLAPVVRKYFGTGNLRPYIGVTTGMAIYYNWFFEENTDNNFEESQFAFLINPEVGVSYWMNDKVFFDLKASYDLLNPYKIDDFNIYKRLELKIGFGVRFGK